MTAGHCLCGSVHYTVPSPAPGEKIVAWSCLCESCRLGTGTFFQTFLGLERKDSMTVTVDSEHSSAQGTIATYSILPGKTRSYCRLCSTPLFWESEGDDGIEVTVGTLLKEDIVKDVKSLDRVGGLAFTWDGLGGMVDATKWSMPKDGIFGEFSLISDVGDDMILPDLSQEKKSPEIEIPAEVQGACVCGGVEYSFKGDKYRAISCHCDSCRLWTGSVAGVCFATIPLETFKLSIAGNPSSLADSVSSLNPEGLVVHFKSATLPKRISCSKCFTSLFKLSSITPHSVDITVATLKDQRVAMLVALHKARTFMGEQHGGMVWRTLSGGLKDGIPMWEEEEG